MSKLICITSRRLCVDDFIRRVRNIIDFGIPVILREKDLSEDDYYRLLRDIDRQKIIAHTFVDAAKKFGCEKIHLPLPILEAADVSGFDCVGSSTHSACEAKRAAELGASYITAGHIFPTDCKRGLSPKGLGVLREIKNEVNIPVYALGGISPGNAADAIAAGADGAAVMSGFMRCADIGEYAEEYTHILS